MERVELQLRLIRAVFRAEAARGNGADHEELRRRCEALLDSSLPVVDGDHRLRKLLDDIRAEIRPSSQ